MSEKKEFAPGIPIERRVQKIPTIKAPKTWDFAVQKHLAERAKEHLDLRLVDPKTNRAHSWALRYLPKPGEMRLAIQQPTHSVEYSLNFEGRIESGYGKGDVELARRDKAEVIKADDKEIRFNIYPGRETEEYILRRKTPDDKNWMLQNVTTSRQAGPGKILPASKPSYKLISPEKLQVDNPETELQAKIDGAHVLYQFKKPGQMPRVVSYRPTERATGLIEHTHKIPGFQALRTPEGLKDTILRGELYAVDEAGKALPAARVGGILNAGVWKSREKQKAEGQLVPVAFDIVRYKGKNVENEPYSIKKKLLESVYKAAPWLQKPRTATTPEEKTKLIKDIKAGKEPSTEEGVVEWNLSKSVPAKSKFLDERDVYVRRIFPEEGTKRKGTMAGGFEFSFSPKGQIIGRTGTGFSHAMKKDMIENPSKYEGLKARIKVQKAPEHYAPRAPSFLSFHLDQEMPEEIKTASATATIRRHDSGGIAIEKLHVPPEERGKGKARKLLSHIKDKYKGASIWVRPRPFGDMPMSIGQLKSFYESEGFKTVDGKDNMILKTASSEHKPWYGSTGNIVRVVGSDVGGALASMKAMELVPKKYKLPVGLAASLGGTAVGLEAGEYTGKKIDKLLAKRKTAQDQAWWRGDPVSPGGTKFIRKFQGITIHIDRPKGFIMAGRDNEGKQWVRKYNYDYGFIPKTKGGDGEGLDVFIGPDKKASEAYWVVQSKKDGSFDEYKVFLGFPDKKSAMVAYREHIPGKYMKGMVTLSLDMMKAMLGLDVNGELTKKASFFMGFQDELEKYASDLVDPEALKHETGKAIEAVKSVATPKGIASRLTEASHALSEDIREKTRTFPHLIGPSIKSITSLGTK